MAVFEVLLMGFLIACALTAVMSRSVITTILTYMGFSIVMSVVWLLLQAPDLAITEAAVGAGISSVLYFLTLRKIHELKEQADKLDEYRRDRKEER